MAEARSNTRAVMEVKMVGQGRAPILRAVYTEDAVMMTHPMQPMRIPAALICPRHGARSFIELICSSLVYPLPLSGESGYGSRTAIV